MLQNSRYAFGPGKAGGLRRGRPMGFLLRFLVLALLAAGCRSVLPPLLAESDGKGSLTVAVHGVALSTHTDSFFRIQLENDRQKYDLTKEITVGDEPKPVSFHNIALGRWRVTVHLVEEEGGETTAITHSGVQDVDVSGERIHVDIPLLPNPGELELVMNLGPDCILIQAPSGCLNDDERAARYVTEPDFKKVKQGDFHWPAGETTHTIMEKEVPLGSYDMQVTFWEDKRIGTPLFQSGWSGFDIFPGRRTRVEWYPELGSIDVGLIVLSPPPPPTDLSVADEGAGPFLTWTGADAPVERYNIYAKGPNQDVFCLVGETEGETPRWPLPGENVVYCGGGDKGFFAARYAVTAVNGDGYESVRSANVAVTEPSP